MAMLVSEALLHENKKSSKTLSLVGIELRLSDSNFNTLLSTLT